LLSMAGENAPPRAPLGELLPDAFGPDDLDSRRSP